MRLYMPEYLKIGFTKRDDTMDTLLAYVTYIKDNKTAKIKSWSSWKDDKIPVLDTINTPTDGFLISKDVNNHTLKDVVIHYLY